MILIPQAQQVWDGLTAASIEEDTENGNLIPERFAGLAVEGDRLDEQVRSHWNQVQDQAVCGRPVPILGIDVVGAIRVQPSAFLNINREGLPLWILEIPYGAKEAADCDSQLIDVGYLQFPVVEVPELTAGGGVSCLTVPKSCLWQRCSRA